ncbi:alpha/beta hydrolase family protein [Novosphingobium soli]|uniref:Alpha/beta hydrolase family protein n=1 Tax=Novosphingobium soli TaxID=574956 RepID=A0ABV6CS91_9SPHN
MTRSASLPLLTLLMACAAPAIAAAAPAPAPVPAPAPAPAPAPIAVTDPVTIVQGPAGRALLLRVTAPLGGRDLPVLVLSHGNLLGRADYPPLVEALARDGWIVIQPDHPDASREGFPPAPYPADTWRIRLEQVDWIAAHLGQVLDRVPGLRARADSGRLALMGHSFGGHTAALAMGARVEDQDQPAPTGRFRAAVLLSPPGNWEGLTAQWQQRGPYMKVDWTGLRGPVLMVNGTADTTPLTDQGPAWHDDGFRLARADADACLMHVEGAGHYLGGIDSVLRGPQGDATPERRARVFAAVTAFLDAAVSRPTGAAAQWPAIRAGLACKR